MRILGVLVIFLHGHHATSGSDNLTHCPDSVVRQLENVVSASNGKFQHLAYGRGVDYLKNKYKEIKSVFLSEFHSLVYKQPIPHVSQQCVDYLVRIHGKHLGYLKSGFEKRIAEERLVRLSRTLRDNLGKINNDRKILQRDLADIESYKAKYGDVTRYISRDDEEELRRRAQGSSRDVLVKTLEYVVSKRYTDRYIIQSVGEYQDSLEKLQEFERKRLQGIQEICNDFDAELRQMSKLKDPDECMRRCDELYKASDLKQFLTDRIAELMKVNSNDNGPVIVPRSDTRKKGEKSGILSMISSKLRGLRNPFNSGKDSNQLRGGDTF